MKIGILTQPLRNNYGGLLQAFALTKILHDMGHKAIILQRRNVYQIKGSHILYLISWWLRCLLHTHRYISQKKWSIIEKNTQDFTNKYIPTSPLIYKTPKLRKFIALQKIEALVVGSDQVWRPQYSPCIEDFFLDFAQNMNIKKIAYAASFGTDIWEFDSKQTKKFSRLLASFDAISVREDSAVFLCQENFKTNPPFHVLDPTLLLSINDYYEIINDQKKASKCDGELFCYILDNNPTKKDFITKCANASKYKPYFCMPKKAVTPNNVFTNIDDCIYPPVEQWLQSFRDAKLVITDSFHGCVFSIIFHKPFWVIKNPQRGNSRFESLLRLFKLEDRAINGSFTNFIWDSRINWDYVDSRIKEEKNKSITFLANALINKK